MKKLNLDIGTLAIFFGAALGIAGIVLCCTAFNAARTDFVDALVRLLFGVAVGGIGVAIGGFGLKNQRPNAAIIAREAIDRARKQ
ncbi:hypothetical protein [Paraburkholderia largidicola]|uniref:Uncharacterized protein n=1 Tax=Paraburkholderia largidicola TaxID=3014751 RepID=A0A7I8C595_9BURK|nr:hypothetical protein [Paraburkholderia sp. PGU16]BCF95378.1 hypothetical protein PPGU16_84450 [Paraburkholderia sp. PGU16]